MKFRTLLLSVAILLAGCSTSTEQEPVDRQTEVPEKIEVAAKSEDTTATKKDTTENRIEYADTYGQAYDMAYPVGYRFAKNVGGSDSEARINAETFAEAYAESYMFYRSANMSKADAHEWAIHNATGFIEAMDGRGKRKAQAWAMMYAMQKMSGYSHVAAKAYVDTYIYWGTRGLDDAQAVAAAEEAARKADKRSQ